MNIETVPMCSGVDGNTNLSTPTTKKVINASVKWFFTLNNWSEEEYCAILERFKDVGTKYVIGKEIGEQGTPHLQGCVYLKKKCRGTSIIANKRIHWENYKDWDAAVTYCKKEGKYIEFPEPPKHISIIKELKPFQIEIENLYLTEPDGRTIHWYVDYIGGLGKTAFTKYMYVKHGALPIKGGKIADISNIIFNFNMDTCKMVIMDIPRSSKSVSYNAIEAILDGMITNTKYETGIKVFNPPHVVVFSNFYPDVKAMSEDRWHIVELNDRPIDDIGLDD